jgi:recombination protein RecA
MQPSPRRIAFSLEEKYRIAPPVKRGLHGGGSGTHPRKEAKGLSAAVDRLLRPEAFAPRRMEDQRPEQGADAMANLPQTSTQPRNTSPGKAGSSKAWLSKPLLSKPWSRMEQALRVVDLILQGGGFSAIVLDLGSIAPEHVARVPLATWFRYRAVAESTQASILLLTQYSCSKSSAELLLRLQPGDALRKEATVFTGMEHGVEVARRRFAQTPSNILPLRKPPQKANSASWQSRTAWAGR